MRNKTQVSLDRKFIKEQKYKTEAETFGWSFVFQDFVSEEIKNKVSQKIEVCRGQQRQCQLKAPAL